MSSFKGGRDGDGRKRSEIPEGMAPAAGYGSYTPDRPVCPTKSARMHALYVASVFLHILAAIIWMGGMFFLILVVVPWLRSGNRQTAGTLLRDTGLRFRTVGWACLGTLLATGTFNLWVRRVRLSDLVAPEWIGTPFGRTVVLKLTLFTVVIALSVVHDFVVGPRATRALQQDPGGTDALRLRRTASWMGRLNALLALALVYLGVVLVRGWP